MVNFPDALDALPNPGPGTLWVGNSDVTLDHDVQHRTLNDAVEATEQKVGINSASSFSGSLDYRIAYCTLWRVGSARAAATASLVLTDGVLADVPGATLTLGNPGGGPPAIVVGQFDVQASALTDVMVGVLVVNGAVQSSCATAQIRRGTVMQVWRVNLPTEPTVCKLQANKVGAGSTVQVNSGHTSITAWGVGLT